MSRAQTALLKAATEDLSPVECLLLARRLACSVPADFHHELRNLGNHLGRHADCLERVPPLTAFVDRAPVEASKPGPNQLPKRPALLVGAWAFSSSARHSLSQPRWPLSKWVDALIGCACLFGFGYIVFFFAGVLSP